MNKQRRQQLERVIELLDEAKGILDIITVEETEAFNNLPNSLHESPQGCALDNNSTLMGDASGLLKDAIGQLREVE